MRRTIFLAAVLFTASAPAHAAGVPAEFQIRTAGLTATRGPGGSYLLTANAHAYRALAGRRVVITFASAARRLPAAAPPRTYITRLRAPRRPAPFRVRPARGVGLCLLDTQSQKGGTLAAP